MLVQWRPSLQHSLLLGLERLGTPQGSARACLGAGLALQREAMSRGDSGSWGAPASAAYGWQPPAPRQHRQPVGWAGGGRGHGGPGVPCALVAVLSGCQGAIFALSQRRHGLRMLVQWRASQQHVMSCWLTGRVCGWPEGVLIVCAALAGCQIGACRLGSAAIWAVRARSMAAVPAQPAVGTGAVGHPPRLSASLFGCRPGVAA